MEAIEIRDLKKEYKNFKLDIKELIVKKGYITGFIGPNGSGKTTTIKAIMNMIKVNSGEILVLNDDISNNTDIKEVLSFVGDTSGFLEEAKLKRIKRSVSRFYKNWDENLYKKIINKFNIKNVMLQFERFNIIYKTPLWAVILVIGGIGIFMMTILVPLQVLLNFEKSRIISIFLTIFPIVYSTELIKILSNVNLNTNIFKILIILSILTLILLSYFITSNLYLKKDIE